MEKIVRFSPTTKFGRTVTSSKSVANKGNIFTDAVVSNGIGRVALSLCHWCLRHLIVQPKCGPCVFAGGSWWQRHQGALSGQLLLLSLIFNLIVLMTFVFILIYMSFVFLCWFKVAGRWSGKSNVLETWHKKYIGSGRLYHPDEYYIHTTHNCGLVDIIGIFCLFWLCEKNLTWLLHCRTGWYSHLRYS